MKLPALQKITGVACATLLGAASTGAIEINPTLDLTGYITGSARWVDQGESDTTLDLDATKILANVKTTPVSGTVSLFASGSDDVDILDAFFSWDLGGGTTLSGGKFLSWHGYEAFDIPNLLQITYSNENILPIIPGYHKGLKIDYVQGSTKMGIALLDGVYDSDGEIEDSFGLEAYYVYSADELTAYLGLAYETGEFVDDSDPNNPVLFDQDSLLLNVWLQYVMGSSTFAGEIAFRGTDSDLGDVDSYFASVLYQYALSEKSWVVLRAAIGEDDFDAGGSEDFLKGTIAFRQKISDNFTVVEELSYSTFDIADSKTFLGVQGRFTF